MFPALGFCQSTIELEIGGIIDKKFLSDTSSNFILTSPSQFRPYFVISIDSVDYIIAYDKMTLEIKYIITNDKDFKTTQGLKIGSEISLSSDEVLIYPGWNVYSKISDDDWDPIVGYNFSINEDSTNFISNYTFKDLSTVTFKILGFSKGGN